MYGKAERWLLLVVVLESCWALRTDYQRKNILMTVVEEDIILKASYSEVFDATSDYGSWRGRCEILLDYENRFPCYKDGSGNPYADIHETRSGLTVVLHRIPHRDVYNVPATLRVTLEAKHRPSIEWNLYFFEKDRCSEEWLFDGNLYNSTLKIDKTYSGKTLTYAVTFDFNETVTADFNITSLPTTIPRHINDSFLVREGSSIRLNDFPRLSPEDCKRMNVTEHWYVNGRETSCPLIIVDRSEKPPVITYVLTGANMKGARYDYNITAAYGPQPNATFEPAQSVHIVRYSDHIPTIRCGVDCFPPCTITWSKDNKKLSETNTLSLGPATPVSIGEYVCTAMNNVTKQWTTRSLFILTESTEDTKGPEHKTALYILSGHFGVLTLVCVTLLLLLRQKKKHQDNSGKNKDSQVSIDQEASGRNPPERVFNGNQTHSGLIRSINGDAEENHYSALETVAYELPQQISGQADSATGGANIYTDLQRLDEKAPAENPYTTFETDEYEIEK